MTIKDSILKWNSEWRYDSWWRKKYNIPFNSESHRSASQIDILFEYMENSMTNEIISKHAELEEKKKKFNNGVWINESIVDVDKEKELFESIDISKM